MASNRWVRRRVGWLIAIGTAVRLLFGALVGLGIDESYAVVSARQVSASYFDHPPVSFWLTHLSATLFGSESHLAVRLPFILLFALTTWLMYRLTAAAFDEYAGWVSALFLNLSAVFSVSTGSWVLPDGPLMCALVAAAYGLVRVLFDRAEERHAWGWWLAAGAATGIGLLSKYQAALFLAGVLLFLAVRPSQRRWLRRPQPYVAAGLVLAMFTPVVVWNARHGWASFAFQLGRNAPPQTLTAARVASALSQNMAGQIGWVLPWIWLPIVVTLIAAFRQRPADDRKWFFAVLAIVPIVLFTAASLGGQPGQPHWPAVGYLFLFPLLGAWVRDRLRLASPELERRLSAPLDDPAATGVYSYHVQDPEDVARDRARNRVWRWFLGSIAAFLLVLAMAGSAAVTGWPARAFPALFRRGDPTLEVVDWTDLRPGLRSLGLLGRPNTFIAGPSWVQSGKVGYALGPDIPVVCLSVDPHQFAFQHDQRAFLGQDAIIVVRLPTPSEVGPRFGPYFDSVTPLGLVTIRRSGRRAFDVGLYLGQHFRRPLPPTSLPPNALPDTVPSPAVAGYLPPGLVRHISGETTR